MAFDIAGSLNEYNTAEQVRELREFVGRGGAAWVTRESADTPNPVVATVRGAELQQGIRSGKYIARKAKSGVMVPVHLVVESRNASKSTIAYDQVVETSSVDAGTRDGLVRTITLVALIPGRLYSRRNHDAGDARAVEYSDRAARNVPQRCSAFGIQVRH